MLVNCVAYENGRKLGDLSIDQISDYVVRPGCFVWVALNDPTEAELDRMRDEFGLHELAVEDARHGHQRPKIEEYGDSLFVVLHTAQVDAEGRFQVGELDIFVAKNYVLSIRQNTPKGFASVRERCEREPDLMKFGSGFVLYALLDAVVDRYMPLVERVEHELETIEERIFTRGESVRTNIEDLYSLKRELMILLHGTAPLIEAVGRLQGGRVPAFCHGVQEYYRDVTDHLLRITRNLESAREMIATAIQVNLSIITVNESEVSKKLASYGALFAVPTAIAGIYGMNFKHMPELESQLGYPVVLLFILIVDVVLFFRFRRAGWL